MLRRGDSVPHFEVKTVDGQPFSYLTVWQQKNLVLVTIPGTEPASDRSYVSRLVSRMPDFTAKDAVCVVTRERLPELHMPAVVVADRWGEIVYVASASEVGALPPPDELLEWLEYLQHRCPECEGEVK